MCLYVHVVLASHFWVSKCAKMLRFYKYVGIFHVGYRDSTMANLPLVVFHVLSLNPQHLQVLKTNRSTNDMHQTLT